MPGECKGTLLFPPVPPVLMPSPLFLSPFSLSTDSYLHSPLFHIHSTLIPSTLCLPERSDNSGTFLQSGFTPESRARLWTRWDNFPPLPLPLPFFPPTSPGRWHDSCIFPSTYYHMLPLVPCDICWTCGGCTIQFFHSSPTLLQYSCSLWIPPLLGLHCAAIMRLPLQ